MEKLKLNSVTEIIDSIRKYRRYFFPVSEPILDQVNLFLLGFIHGQRVALNNQKKVDFDVMSRFSVFVDKKLGVNRKVVNDWWVEIRLHYSEEQQMDAFFKLWDEYCATIN
ncbi:MAG: hypothetical protein HYZ14_04840 [Bacteroidetes bacterium]|nr:hypothetical protein [Bacteroidota bacterium]